MNYGARHAILLTVIMLSAAWAAFGAVGGTAVSAILFALAAYFLVRESRWTRSIRIAAVWLGLLALVGLVLSAVPSAREAAHGMQCENHLRQIGIAVRAYGETYGCLPPTCIYDKSGHPMHSWRLLLIPFMFSTPDYDLYNFTEPWDSPRNRKILNRRLSYVFHCPTDPAAHAPGSTVTSYVALVGKRSAWRFGKFDSTNQKAHGQAADVFLVIETANTGIQWAEPKDIDFDDAPALLSIAAKGSHAHYNGYFFHTTPAVNAVLVHGDMVFMFPWDCRPSVLMATLPPDVLLLPHDERERIVRALGKDSPYNELRREELRVHWPHLIGLPVWMVAVVLLAYQGIVSSRRRGV